MFEDVEYLLDKTSLIKNMVSGQKMVKAIFRKVDIDNDQKITVVDLERLLALDTCGKAYGHTPTNSKY